MIYSLNCPMMHQSLTQCIKNKVTHHYLKKSIYISKTLGIPSFRNFALALAHCGKKKSSVPTCDAFPVHFYDRTFLGFNL